MHLNNLFLAGIWTVLGVSLIFYDLLVPGGGAWRIFDTNISLGWIALILAGYNIVRWWSRRKSWKTDMERKESRRRADLVRRDREFQESGRERDPNFIFDEPPESRKE
jgi:hypothetical protein